MAETRVALTATARVGEGPVWDPVTEVLLWVDIPAGLVHTSWRETRQTTTLELPTCVGAVAPTVDGGLVVAGEQGFGLVTTDASFAVRRPVLAPGAPGDSALDGSLFAVTATGATGLASAPFAGSS
jgi:sugar lactone lactonase YvrE